MTDKNNIDDLFKDGLNNQQPEFNMDAWNKMEDLLDDNDRKRTPWYFNTFFGVGLSVLLLAGGAYFITNPNISANNEITAENNSPESLNTQLTENNKVENTLTNLISKPSGVDENNTESNQNENIVADKSINSLETKAVKNVDLKLVTHHKKTVSKQGKTAQSVKKKTPFNKISSTVIENKKIKNVDLNSSAVTIKTSSNSKTTTSNQGGGGNISASTNNNYQASSNNSQKTISPQITVTSNKYKVQSTSYQMTNDSQQASNNNNQITNNKTQSSTSITQNPSLEYTIPPFDEDEKSISLMPFNPISIIPTENEEAKLKKKEKKEKVKPTRDWLNPLRKANIGVIAGSGIARGYINNSVSRGSLSITPVLGLRTSFLINESASIDINLLYYNKGGLNSSLDIVGNNGQTTSNNFKSLHYISIPVYLNFKTARGGWLIGLRFSKLMTVKNEITQDKIIDGNITQTTFTEWGSNKNFSNSDLAFTFGYQYLLNERLSIGTRFYYGLYDVTDNASFRNSVRDNNLELHFTLDYTLFKY